MNSWASNIKTLISEEEISKRVKELGEQISRDYHGEQLVLVGVLKGAAIFLSDLLRTIDLPVTYDFVAISSYGAGLKSTGVVRLIKDTDINLEGMHVLIVEDIIDTGLSLRYLRDLMLSRNPATLKVCALLEKPSRKEDVCNIDYLGFTIPDEFVVGYGLDVSERFRNLAYIGIYEDNNEK